MYGSYPKQPYPVTNYNCHTSCPPKKEKKIKTFVVIAEENIQKVGDLVIDAPIGVDINKISGVLTVPVILKPIGQPVMTPKIIKDKLINEGLVHVKLIIENNDPQPCPGIQKNIWKQLTIPVQDVREIKGIEPGDQIEEIVEIESLSVFGLPSCPQSGQVGTVGKLIIKVILKVRIIITRLEILTISVC